MRALVTGATGFIGQHLSRRLVDLGHDVRALVRPGRPPRGLEDHGIEIARGDMLDRPAIERSVENRDIVFHLAKTSAADRTRQRGVDPDVIGAVTVAEAALEVGAERVVFASSTRVYGTVQNLDIDETTPTRPDTTYARSKLAAERRLLDLSDRGDGSVVVARITSVFGEGVAGWRGFFEAIGSGQLRMVGEGDNHFQPADVEDVVEGLISCGARPGIGGRVYNLTGEAPIRLREIVEIASREFGVKTSRSRLPVAALRAFSRANGIFSATLGRDLPRIDRVELFLSDRAFDLTRARRDLDFAPRITATETVRRTARWVHDQ